MNTLKEYRSNSKVVTTPEPALPKSTSTSTSILMPTIVGKSVQGSAMQAMQRARARATAIRSSAPPKPNIGSGSAPKDLKRSTWNAREMKKQTKKESNETLKYLPSSLARDYIGILSKLATEESMTTIVNLLQKTFVMWLVKFKGDEIPFKAMEFILPHANYVNIQTFSLIQSVVIDPIPFLKYMSYILVSQFTNTIILSSNFGLRNKELPMTTMTNLTVYIMRKIKNSEQKSIIFIYEVSVISHISLKRIGRIKCWSFMQHNGNRLTAKEKDFATLNIRRDLFNFSSSIIRSFMKHSSYDNMSYLDMSLLLRETKSLFPTRIQRR